MSTTTRVYPGNAPANSPAFISELKKNGIKRSVKWSATDLGPHFHFDFSDLEQSELSETSIPNSTPQTKIGAFSKENPLGAINFAISMDEAGEIWMWVQGGVEQLSPIFLASSPLNLAQIVDRFTVHLEDLERSTKESEWEDDWRRFLDDCRKLDAKGGSSYWASLAEDYLDHE